MVMGKSMKLQWILIAILMFVGLSVEAFNTGVNGNIRTISTPPPVFSQPINPTGISSTVFVQPQTSALSAESVGNGQIAPVLDAPVPIEIPPVPPSPPADVSSVNLQIGKCNASAKKASSICVAATSPAIQTGIVAVTGILSAIDMASSTNQSCKKFGDALDIAKAAMTAYTLACGIVQKNCMSTCTPVKAGLAALPSAATGPSSAAYDLVVRKCAGYQLSLVAAGAGIMSILSESLIGQKCQKATAAVDCVLDPMNASCVKALDCSKSENVANTTCICQKAPNTPGCSTYTGSYDSNGVKSSDVNQAENLNGGSLDLTAPNLGSDGMISPSGGSLSGAGGNGVAPTGGGGGGGGLSGGGSDGNKGAQKPGSKPMNTNILSGYEGGGGGGARGGGGAYGSGSDNSGLQAYLPKGEKDPARNPAMQLFGNGEVTGAGSKSNFEKVNERYNDAKGSLITP